MSPLTSASFLGAVATTVSVAAATVIHHITELVLLPSYLGLTVVLLGIVFWAVWGWSFARDRQNEHEERRQALELARRYDIDPDHVSMQRLLGANDAIVLYPNFGGRNVDYGGDRKGA